MNPTKPLCLPLLLGLLWAVGACGPEQAPVGEEAAASVVCSKGRCSMSWLLGSFVWNPQVIAPGRRLSFTIHNSLHLADHFLSEERNALHLAAVPTAKDRNALRLADRFLSNERNALHLAGVPTDRRRKAPRLVSFRNRVSRTRKCSNLRPSLESSAPGQSRRGFGHGALPRRTLEG